MARDEEYPGLTCWFWGELVPVGGAHGQQTVAQVQVEALLRCYTADHLRMSGDTRLKRAGLCEGNVPVIFCLRRSLLTVKLILPDLYRCTGGLCAGGRDATSLSVPYECAASLRRNLESHRRGLKSPTRESYSFDWPSQSALPACVFKAFCHSLKFKTNTEVLEPNTPRCTLSLPSVSIALPWHPNGACMYRYIWRLFIGKPH